MIKPLYLLPLFMLLFSCNRVSRLYVQYAEAKTKYESFVDSSVVRIYLDRNGSIYPDFAMRDKKIKASGSLLNEFYNDNPAVYNAVCLREEFPVYGVNSIPVDALQTKLIENQIKKINQQGKQKEIVFIIHGFNEHPTLSSRDNSFVENKATRELIQNGYKPKTFLFVEIYWDGMSRKNGWHNFISQGLNSIKIWDNAQVSAVYAGLELRRIISKIDAKTIYFITHSHGAGVATNALFNVMKFNSDYFADTSYAGGAFIIQKYSDPRYETPKQNIYIGMLAPAIPGENVFDEYYDRTVNGKNIVDSSQRNYHFIVGFNKFDIVTRKIYTNSAWFGTSTLACRKSELAATLDLIGDPSLLDYEDFSYLTDNKKQRLHDWLVYLRNEPEITRFLNKVFIQKNN